MLLKLLQQKINNETPKIFLTKNNFRKKLVGNEKVNSLLINSNSQFEFITERDGYVMMLNIGTSGSIFLHVPNAYITAQKAQVYDGRYTIPGKKLLPYQQLQKNGHEYLEGGPAGLEHIAIIISDEILVPSSIVERSTCEIPFVKLTSEDIQTIFQKFSNIDSSSWSVGILSFLVE